MKRALALASIGVVLAVPTVRAEHLAQKSDVQSALASRAETRAATLEKLDLVLSTPVALRTAQALGTDASALKRALPTLTDAEVRDLAQRAAALDVDPAAGLSRDVNDLLIVFLVVAIVILVLQAV